MLMRLDFTGAYAVSYFQKSNGCFAQNYSVAKLDISDTGNLSKSWLMTTSLLVILYIEVSTI